MLPSEPDSSQQNPAAPSPAEAVERPSVVAHGETTALSTAEERLPDAYPVDYICLLVQSPQKLFLSWNCASDPFATLSKAFGPLLAAHYKLILRVINIASDANRVAEVTHTGTQWLEAQPGESYQAHLGLFAANRPSIHLLSSNIARTPPPPGVSHNADTAAPEFQVAPSDFANLLHEAGYASDSVQVRLEVVDQRTHVQKTHNDATRVVDE